MFSLVHLVQNPYAPIFPSEEVIVEGDRIFRKLLERGPIRNPIPLMFQIESELTYLDSISKRRGLSAFGYFEGSWVTISKVPLNYLFETEMIGVERTVAEILIIISRGTWAPIVTDEHLNNTDGSHRAIAVGSGTFLIDLYNLVLRTWNPARRVSRRKCLTTSRKRGRNP